MNPKEYLVGNTTFVVLNHHQIHTSSMHGIRPVLDFLEAHSELLVNSDVADRIIGKAASMLLEKANIDYVYAEVLSKQAIPILEKYEIAYEYGTLTDYIENRTKTGMCPMEETVKNIDDLDEAYLALKRKVEELSK